MCVNVKFLYCISFAGGETLGACGMMESLLKVVNWYSDGADHITVSYLIIIIEFIDLPVLQIFFIKFVCI